MSGALTCTHSVTARESTGWADSAAAKRNWPSSGGAAAEVVTGIICRAIADRNDDVALDCLLAERVLLKVRLMPELVVSLT